MNVMKHFAPKGYIATPVKLGCIGCAYDEELDCRRHPGCTPTNRPDKQNVIFKKENTHANDETLRPQRLRRYRA